MATEELTELTRIFVNEGDFESSKDTTRELQKRFPYNKVRDELSTANFHLCLLFEELRKIEKQQERKAIEL